MNENQALQVIDKLSFFADFSPEEKKFSAHFKAISITSMPTK
jgi:hypothetical protein